MTLPLINKTALVTGGSRSIGAAIVKKLSDDGGSGRLHLCRFGGESERTGANDRIDRRPCARHSGRQMPTRFNTLPPTPSNSPTWVTRYCTRPVRGALSAHSSKSALIFVIVA